MHFFIVFQFFLIHKHGHCLRVLIPPKPPYLRLWSTAALLLLNMRQSIDSASRITDVPSVSPHTLNVDAHDVHDLYTIISVCSVCCERVADIRSRRGRHAVLARLRNFRKTQPPAGRHRPSSRSIPVDKIYTFSLQDYRYNIINFNTLIVYNIYYNK